MTTSRLTLLAFQVFFSSFLTVTSTLQLVAFSSLTSSIISPQSAQLYKAEPLSPSLTQLSEPMPIWARNPITNQCLSNFTLQLSIPVTCLGSPFKITILSPSSLLHYINPTFHSDTSLTSLNSLSLLKTSYSVCKAFFTFNILIQSQIQPSQCSTNSLIYFIQKYECCPKPGQYYNSSSCLCKARCGDGIWAKKLEGCDDGNEVDKDGCSSKCKVEEGWKCEVKDWRSVCKEEAKVKLVYVEKEQYENKFRVKLDTFGNHSVYEKLDFREILVVTGVAIELESWKYNVTSESLILYYSYVEEDLNNAVANFTFTFPSANYSLSIPFVAPSKLSFHPYSPSLYNLAQYSTPIYKTLLSLCYLLLFFSPMSLKLATLDLFTVFQILFGTTVQYATINPFTSAMISEFKNYASGYNERVYDVEKDISSFSPLGYSVQLMNNMNWMLYVIVTCSCGIGIGMMLGWGKWQGVKALKIIGGFGAVLALFDLGVNFQFLMIISTVPPDRLEETLLHIAIILLSIFLGMVIFGEISQKEFQKQKLFQYFFLNQIYKLFFAVFCALMGWIGVIINLVLTGVSLVIIADYGRKERYTDVEIVKMVKMNRVGLLVGLGAAMGEIWGSEGVGWGMAGVRLLVIVWLVAGYLVEAWRMGLKQWRERRDSRIREKIKFEQKEIELDDGNSENRNRMEEEGQIAQEQLKEQTKSDIDLIQRNK